MSLVGRIHAAAKQAGLDDEVGLRLPPEAAAEQGDVHLHLVLGQAEALGEAGRAGPGTPMFGRKALLWLADGRPLGETVEILPRA